VISFLQRTIAIVQAFTKLKKFHLGCQNELAVHLGMALKCQCPEMFLLTQVPSMMMCTKFARTSSIWIFSQFGGVSYGLQQSYITCCWGQRQQQSLTKVPNHFYTSGSRSLLSKDEGFWTKTMTNISVFMNLQSGDCWIFLCNLIDIPKDEDLRKISRLGFRC
jgi:hypothetical protein